MSAALQTPASPHHEAELRVLSGRHAGATVPLAGSLRLGPQDECDVILSDMAHDGPAWLHVAAGRWRITRAAPQDGAVNDPVMAEGDLLLAPLALGEAGTLGGVALTVSAPHAPWQKPAAQATGERRGEPRTSPAPAPSSPLARADAAQAPEPSRQGQADQSLPTADAPAAQAAPAPRAGTARVRGGHRTALASGATLLVLGAGALTAIWALRHSPPPAATANTAAAPRPDPTRLQQQLQDIRLALATVDPGLRLATEALPGGGARVSGWVADVDQLDRVTAALASVRPPPQLALRTTADLLDDLRSAAAASGAALSFELDGAGSVRVLGSVLTAAEHAQALAALQGRLPPGVALSDGMRVAQAQAPAVQQWLQQRAGLQGAQARWDADAGQLLVRVDVTPQQRALLERLLAQRGHPLEGVPFTLVASDVAPTPPAPPLHASAAPLPFRIRGVVGGASPYVVLGDGAKLQPGGQRSGWRLERITPDTLVFDGPRHLVLAR